MSPVIKDTRVTRSLECGKYHSFCPECAIQSVCADQARAREGAEHDVLVSHSSFIADLTAPLTHAHPVPAAVAVDEADDFRPRLVDDFHEAAVQSLRRLGRRAAVDGVAQLLAADQVADAVLILRLEAD